MTRLSCKHVVIACVLAGIVHASTAVGAEPLRQQQEPPAGIIFGVLVSASNYYFAKRVSYLFPRPGEEELSTADRERAIWEALILHYESFRRGVSISEDELEKDINVVLKDQQQSFTRAGDHASYTRWVRDTLNEDVEPFENQMRYLFQIDKLKQQVRESLPVTVTEEEMQAEFLNEHHHVGGEFVLFDSKVEAEAFYARVKEPAQWEEEKRQHPDQVRPFNIITLEAIIDLWGVPKEQIYAFHAMPLGSIGPPMPFGTKQWGVFRLLEKRTGELQQFSEQRASYQRQLQIKQQYLGLKQWIEDLKTSARLQILPLPDPAS